MSIGAISVTFSFTVHLFYEYVQSDSSNMRGRKKLSQQEQTFFFYALQLFLKQILSTFSPMNHESLVMTERVRSQDSASVRKEILRRIGKVTLFNKVHSSEIRKLLNIKPLLHRIERYQHRWFGHVSRTPQENSPNNLYLSTQMGEDQLDDLELDGAITLRILGGIAWDCTQAK